MSTHVTRADRTTFPDVQLIRPGDYASGGAGGARGPGLRPQTSDLTAQGWGPSRGTGRHTQQRHTERAHATGRAWESARVYSPPRGPRLRFDAMLREAQETHRARRHNDYTWVELQQRAAWATSRSRTRPGVPVRYMNRPFWSAYRLLLRRGQGPGKAQARPAGSVIAPLLVPSGVWLESWTVREGASRPAWGILRGRGWQTTRLPRYSARRLAGQERLAVLSERGAASKVAQCNARSPWIGMVRPREMGSFVPATFQGCRRSADSL